MKKLRNIIIISIIIILAIVYTVYNFSIGKERRKKEQESTANKEKIIANDIRIGIVNFDTINPILSNNTNVQNVARLIFDPLITLTEDFKLEGSLATEWIKLDKTTYLIKLRENVNWQDGNKFNSDDVIFTVNILKTIDSIYSYNVENIKDIQKIDESTIKIITKRQEPYFEYNLIFPIMSSKYFNEKNFSSEKKNENPVGTGKYYISDYNSNNIILKKNTNWWENKDLKLDTIKVNLYNSMNNALTEFKTNNVDIITTSLTNIEEYIEGSEYKKVNYIGREYDYLALNCNHQILKNKEIRQAINKAINKDAMIEKVYNNHCIKSNFPLDFGSFLYPYKERKNEYNTEEAKQLLKKAKWKETNHLNLLVNKDDSNRIKMAQNIKEQLEEVGIHITVIEKKEERYQKDIQNGNYEIVLTGTTYGYSPSLNFYFEKGNIANYSNQEIIEKIKQTEDSTEEEQKRNILDIATKYLEDVPYISLYYNTISMIYSNNLKGKVTPNSYHIFYHIEDWYREYDKL